MANVKLSIVSEFLGKGLKDADKSIKGFEKSVKQVGYLFGGGYLGAKVLAFSKTAVSAFLDDEAAANKLSLAVKNLGIEFANPYIAKYISQLEQTAKVADDQLRPAFQSLLQQTGSLAKAQSILNTAIEASRGSGYDLSTVSNDLAQAYVGNTKGLRKYYLGLDSATLKAKSFTEIQEIMNKQFAGSNTAYLATYSGQVGVLSLAWQNFQEKVGATLLTLASFGDGSNGGKLNLLALSLEKIGSAIELIGKGKETLFGLLDLTGPNGLLSKFNPYQIGTAGKPDDSPKVLTKYEKLLADIEADRKKQNEAITKNKKQQLALDKAKASLAKAQASFDITKINLAAALKGKVSEDEKNRLLALQAIENNNGDEALKYIAKIDAAREAAAAKELARQKLSYDDALAKIKALNDAIASRQQYLLTIGMNTVSSAAASGSASGYSQSFLNDPYVLGGSPESLGLSDRANTERNAAMNIVLNIDGTQVSNALYNNSNSGTASSSSRSTGTFSA